MPIGRASAGLIWVAMVSVAAAAPSHAFPVFDGHNDLAIHYLRAEPRWSINAHDLARRMPGQSDIPRMQAGGVIGALITVGSDQEPASAGHFPRALASLDWFDAIVRRHANVIVHARSADEIAAARQAGRIAFIPAIEGGDQIDGSLRNLRTAWRRGVRSMTIVYDHHNAFGDGAMAMPWSSPSLVRPHGGLSRLGRRLVVEMNAIGMLVDLSHASEATALQALEIARAPAIFSHSGARALADTPRNLSDRTLRALARNGGIVMVPLVPFLTTTAHWRWWSSGEARYAALNAELAGDETRVAHAMAEWDRTHPEPPVTIADVADQIDHVARIAGHDHVGIGSDFDGMGRFVVRDLADASRLPLLFAELERRGWTESQLNALASGNFERVLRAAGRRHQAVQANSRSRAWVGRISTIVSPWQSDSASFSQNPNGTPPR